MPRDTTDLASMLNDPSLLATKAYVAGEWIDADSGKTFDVTNPARGDVICAVPDLGRAETARAIEEAHFRASFADRRIVLAGGDDSDSAVLLAIDEDDLVVGVTREARRVFGLAAGPLAPRPASDLLGREGKDGPTGFARAERTAVIRALARTGGNVTEAARALGVGRATLYRRMKRLGLS